MFTIDPKVYSSMFSLPTQIADKALKFASGDQIKVIICIFRNPDTNILEIAKKINLSEDAVRESVEFWEDMGILKGQESKNTVKTESEIAKDDKNIKPALPQIHFVNPTQEEIAKIITQNGSMNRLFNEAQLILGKTIGYTMQCTIYSIVNFYGITPDVVNCLLHFARSIGCTSQNDIQKIAKYWAENGISDLSSADEYINETTKANGIFCEIAEKTNNSSETPSFAILEMIAEWMRWGYKTDVILKAFEIMKTEKQTGRLNWNNFRHMNGTIKNWRSLNMITLEDIEKGTKKFATKESTKNNSGKKTSFDVELAEKSARTGTVDFVNNKNKKRKKSREA